VQPVCFWDVMPIPRYALTVRFFAQPQKSERRTVFRSAGSPASLRATYHDYHSLRDKVNAVRDSRR
jgi:hypothetical protein